LRPASLSTRNGRCARRRGLASPRLAGRRAPPGAHGSPAPDCPPPVSGASSAMQGARCCGIPGPHPGFRSGVEGSLVLPGRCGRAGQGPVLWVILCHGDQRHRRAGARGVRQAPALPVMRAAARCRATWVVQRGCAPRGWLGGGTVAAGRRVRGQRARPCGCCRPCRDMEVRARAPPSSSCLPRCCWQRPRPSACTR